MAKTAKTTALATVDSVPEILKGLDAKIASLKKIVDTPYKTSGVISEFGESYDIKKITEVKQLGKIYSALLFKKEYYDKAFKELGVSTHPAFEVGGNSLEDWKHDIKLRIAIVNQDVQFKKLQEYKDRASKLMSAEDQKAMLLSELSTYLGDIE